MDLLDALTVLPASVPFALNLANRTRWPRATEVADEVPPRVSILVPARNEEANVERCVRAALAVVPPVHEVVVCDDDSTDATPAILARLAAEDARVRVIGGGPLPPGWVGKPHACHRLGEAATCDLLVFVDADTELTVDGVRRLWSVFGRYRAKVVTAFPRQVVEGVAEQALVPLLALTFTSWVPLDLVWKHVDPALLVVNGQVMAFRREAYEEIGGYAAVAGDIVDDVAIARRAKELDQRVVFVDGQDLASCRMYRAAAEVWAGFSKNFFEGLGERLPLLLAVVSIYFLAFVFPYLRLAGDLATVGAPSLAALVGVALNLGARGILAARLGHTLLSVVLHPLAVLALVGIAFNSAVWSRRGTVRWRGRVYGPRSTRAT